ncbi:MAG TPA: enoyl-CoA hydratase/isomerase family protein [Solirubrobacterales bacterium]|nr:enoyl-CoA hydratase/isomerase family protein [Solirubrobacterales bacterium]
MEPSVLVRRVGAAGHLVLNRPRAINALTLEMVETLDRALVDWETDPEVTCVLLTGAGERGLCAGGDIVMMRDSILGDGARTARTFWRAEYLLDARIAAYPKPFVAAMDGIVMGGGVGLACHATHRLASERLVLAMPEVGIGLHPDCGAAYLLARSPGQLGTHLVLTGGRIGAADAVLCGLADRVVSAESLAQLPELLAEGRVEEAVAGLPGPPDPVEPTLLPERGWIDDGYRGASVEAILARLHGLDDPAAAAAAATIESKSPTALKVSLAALRRAREMTSLEQCFDQDYRVSAACAADPDLVEGIRAQVVDKDREPRWRPSALSAVTEAAVERHFAAVDDELGLEPAT